MQLDWQWHIQLSVYNLELLSRCCFSRKPHVASQSILMGMAVCCFFRQWQKPERAASFGLSVHPISRQKMSHEEYLRWGGG